MLVEAWLPRAARAHPERPAVNGMPYAELLGAAREAADDGWPAPLRQWIPVNVTVPAVDAGAAAAIVRDSSGCRTAKVKVAEPEQTLADDQARLEAVRDALVADVAEIFLPKMEQRQ